MQTERTKSSLELAVPAVAAGPARERRPVVLLRSGNGAHLQASRWANRVAAALGAEVTVVRVIGSPPPRANVLFPQLNQAEELFPAEKTARALDAQVRWRRRFAAPAAGPAMLSLKQEGTTSLASALAQLRPLAVVVPASKAWPGDAVMQLARACAAPVLVARSTRPGPVLAASSLRDAQLPVVHQAADWAHLLGRPLSIVHNLETSAYAWAGFDAFPFVLPELDELGSEKAKRLQRVALEADAEASVTHALDPVAGILNTARQAAAGLVVVGAPDRQGWFSRHVAARVVASAKRSVLVVPLPASGRASRAEAPRMLDERSKS